MARQPKRDFGDIIAPSGNGNLQKPTPEPNPEQTPETSEAKKRSYPSREGKRPVQFFISEDAHTQLRIVCAERKMNNQVVLTEALNDWFQLNGLPPIA